MNRRSFLKWLGIGTATAAFVPQLLAKEPEVYPEANCPITLEMLQTAYGQTLFQPSQVTLPARYMYVYVEKNTVPFRVGDLVRYKVNKRGETIAYRAPRSGKWNMNEYYGIAINNVSPGNYTFIQISGASPAGGYGICLEAPKWTT